MLKIAIPLVATLVSSSLAYANRPIDVQSLDGLQALDDGGGCDKTICHAFTSINEKALAYMPTAVTLRAEDAVARVYVLATAR